MVICMPTGDLYLASQGIDPDNVYRNIGIIAAMAPGACEETADQGCLESIGCLSRRLDAGCLLTTHLSPVSFTPVTGYLFIAYCFLRNLKKKS